MVVYIVDDMLYLLYKNKLISVNLKGIISKGYIIDRVRFMESFLNTLKTEKIKGKLFGDEVTIVKNAYYKTSDIFYLENIFSELGFIKVHFWNIRDLLPEDEATYIEINNSYLVIYLDTGIYLDMTYFKDIPKILEYFSSFMNDNVILFGVNKYIPEIKIEKKKIYYFENFESYITQGLLKVKKCDA